MVVYYSRSGNTKRLADAVAAQKGESAFALAPKKPEGMFLGAAKSFLRRATEVRELPVLTGGEAVVLCTPVWAGTFPPVVRGFLQSAILQGRAVTLLLTCGDLSAAYDMKLSAELQKMGVTTSVCRVFRGKASPAPEELAGL